MTHFELIKLESSNLLDITIIDGYLVLHITNLQNMVSPVVTSWIKGTALGTLGFDPRFLKGSVKSFYHAKMLVGAC